MKTLFLIAFSFLSLNAQIPASPNEQQILHFLSHTTSGIQTNDLQKIHTIGVSSYLRQQLDAEAIPPSVRLSNALSSLESNDLNVTEMYARYFPGNLSKADAEQKKSFNQLKQRIGREAIQAKLYRSLYSDAQLAEVMDDFWFNHFNVFWQKAFNPMLIGAYDRDAIRPYVLGRFRDMLGAVAKHPAMLMYLDNRFSVKYNPNNGKGLNENYAREVMELHTLGVGNYTQKDVTELARIFTGWGISPQSGFRFSPNAHDSGEKFFLGYRFPAGGMEEEGERALDILAASPITAHRISEKLCAFFVADTPPETLVKRITQIFLKTDGNIKECVRTILESDEFWDEKNFNTQFKNPYRYVMSALRQTNADIDNPGPIIGVLNRMGMPIYGRLTPDGYPNGSDSWMSPSAMQLRIDFATVLGHEKFQGCTGGCKIDLDALRGGIGPLQKNLVDAVRSNPSGMEATLLLASPQMMMY